MFQCHLMAYLASLYVLSGGPEGVKWELGFAHFSTWKMGFEHWGWDLETGTGKKVAYNGNGKDVL